MAEEEGTVVDEFAEIGGEDEFAALDGDDSEFAKTDDSEFAKTEEDEFAALDGDDSEFAKTEEDEFAALDGDDSEFAKTEEDEFAALDGDDSEFAKTEETIEVAAEEVAVEEKPKAPKRGRKVTTEEPEAKDETDNKGENDPTVVKKEVEKPTTRKKKTAREKFMTQAMKRAGVEELPELSALVREKEGTVKMAIKDIAIFVGTPKDDLLKEIAVGCSNTNTVNLSAEVTKKRVLAVGELLLKAGRMYQPIQVSDIAEPDSETDYQCVSGRHRLTFLALAYGADAKVSVEIDEMSLCEARDAVLYANMSRSTGAMEKIEYAVLAAVGGNVDADRDDMYTKTATKKAAAKKYASYCVFKQENPKLAFKVGVRSAGGLTTVAGIEGFWGAACPWHKETTREEYDAELEASTTFVNSLAEEMQKVEGFDASQHMSSTTMSAIGKAFCDTKAVAGEGPDVVKVATSIVGMGAIGRQTNDVTYKALMAALR